jgi:hypothetical protein
VHKNSDPEEAERAGRQLSAENDVWKFTARQIFTATAAKNEIWALHPCF